MEGSISLGVLAERVKTLDARTRSNHDSIAEFRRKEGERAAQETKRAEAWATLVSKVEDQGADIAEMKGDLRWIKRGLFGAIAVGLMFTVAVASLVIQAAH